MPARLLLVSLCSLFSLGIPLESRAEEPTQSPIAAFAPPLGWRLAEKQSLPPHVHIMVVGKGKHAYPPSINLASEEYFGNLTNYLEIVKKINNNGGFSWKSLGTICTAAGEANLSQVDMRTEWGEVKMMHAILFRENVIYIMTVSALKSEFSAFYKDFYAAMRSLAIAKMAEK